MIAALRRVLPLVLFIAGCAAAQPAAAECYGTGADKAPACQTVPSYLDGSGIPTSVSASNPLPISGSFSASLAGFTPAAGATANVTDIVNTSQDVALPSGTDAVVTNKGTVDVNFRIQAGAGTAVATDQTLKAGAAIGIHVGTATHLSVIAPTGTGTGTTAGQLNIQGGAGLATGYGGSSSSGGGAGDASASNQTSQITQETAINTVLGTKTDAKSTATDTTSVSQMQVLKQISASVQAPPSQAVTNAGTFAAQLTGSTNNINNISGTVSLPTGAATAANQTTGNTNTSTTATNTGTTATNTGSISTVLGSKTDAKSTATDATSVSAMSVLKQISASAQSGTAATAAAVPSSAIYAGANSGGNLTGIIQADASVAINISTATTTQLVALSAGKKIYVSGWDVIAAGTGNITLEYGTGTNCGTGTTVLTGAYNLTAQAGIARGNGLGPVLIIPAGNALCALTSAAVQMSGSLAYTQF